MMPCPVSHTYRTPNSSTYVSYNNSSCSCSFRFYKGTYERRTLLNRNDYFFINRIEHFDSIWCKHTRYEFASYRNSQKLEERSISRNTRLTTTIVVESDGVHGRVRASLCFVLAAQARKPALSASLGWAEEAPKRHARNSDGDAAIIEVLKYPLCYR